MLSHARTSLNENMDLFDPASVAAAQGFLRASEKLTSPFFWPLRTQVAVDLFLWHLDAFAGDEDPNPLFVAAVERATRALELAPGLLNTSPDFYSGDADATNEAELERLVPGLFSDIWLGFTDDIYFDETNQFVRARFEKNGLDPDEIFKNKVVLDAGCGSGKFSAVIAKLGAKKVIGLDLGERGLDFARKQAEKIPEGAKIEYLHGSLLDVPLDDGSVDFVFSNGVIHHTTDFERCIAEFARVVRPGGELFLYVNGRFGLFELLLDTIRLAMRDVPRTLYLHFLRLLGMNAGRVYWVADCSYAPYEWKAQTDVEALLTKHGFSDIHQLTRGVPSDQIEQVSAGIPFAEVKYGEAQLKFVCRRT